MTKGVGGPVVDANPVKSKFIEIPSEENNYTVQNRPLQFYLSAHKSFQYVQIKKDFAKKVKDEKT